MRTLLSRFCEEFVEVLRPVLAPLGQSVDALDTQANDSESSALQQQLTDLRLQLGQLSDKVAEQQAYVLIFGPLKSGKSTLMNAICATYVSEVSSLPAYPCMVFVSHAPQREYVLTDYAGKTESFTDAAVLKYHVDRAHQELAAKIRATESHGDVFDPAKHFPQAIRRVDVKVPAGELAQSGAVLVDTPGLYSRMKFGYDRMTRDFRNAAACAVFVVRSDNLFLEQVFHEFNQLLELFSRIFLVVNLDTTKRDLSPNGELVPSLESADPKKLIEAFENLTMSAPLKKAADEGRLKIYPMGLLEAARERLDHSGKKVEDAKMAPIAGDFDGFMKDLGEFLNSTDYLVSFLGDSLRRAGTLLEECDKVCGSDAIRELEQGLERVREEHKATTEGIESLGSVDETDWRQVFRSLRESLGPAIERQAEAIESKTAKRIDEAITAWFKSNTSFYDLVRNKVDAILTTYQEDLTTAVSRELGERVLRAGAGLEFPDDCSAAFRRLEIDVDGLCRGAHRKTDRGALISVPPTALRTENVPVKKGIWDWVFFRSQATMQRRLFGPPEKPSLSISRDLKNARIGEEGKAAMRKRLANYSKGFFAETLTRIRKGFLDNYCELVKRSLQSKVHEAKGALQERLLELNAQEERAGRLLEPLTHLRDSAGEAKQAMTGLSDHYGQVDLFLLTQPVRPDGTAPRPDQKPAIVELKPQSPPQILPQSAQKAVEAKTESPAASIKPQDAGPKA